MSLPGDTHGRRAPDTVRRIYYDGAGTLVLDDCPAEYTATQYYHEIGRTPHAIVYEQRPYEWVPSPPPPAARA